jgi:hypothetical protein
MPEDMEEGKPDAARKYNPEESARRWERELQAAKKELSKFHESARKIVKKYLDKRDQLDTDSAFKLNLFWSNIQVLKASLYAKPPRVDVSNSFKDSDDDVSRVAGNILERMLNHSIEKDNSDFETSSQLGVGDYLIVGLGALWYRYEVETGKQMTEPVKDPQNPEQIIVPAKEYEAIIHEDCLTEYVFWEDFWWSPARTWDDVRWVARRVYMNKEQLRKRFGDVIAEQVPLSKQKKNADSTQPQNDPWNKAGVFEIWDRTTKKVYWHVLGMHTVLDEKDDPLKLETFFPCPPPLISNPTTSNVMPLADYALAQDQYDQIDELTTRITHLTRAAKVVGAYDSSSTELGRIFSEGMENQMIPVTNWAQFSEKGGIRGSMDFVPIDMIAKTIADLTQQRDILIAKLYEVLGIGDIMRGMSNPDETLGAQQLKAQFGGSRLQFKQMDIGKWVAAGQRIRAQIICYHFQPETIIERSNINNSVDKPLVPQAIAMLKQDATKRYRITVESETMAMVDWAQERDARVQFMQAVGGFVQSVTPLIESSPKTAPIVLQMMKWGLGGFRVGKEIETVLDAAIAAAQQDQGQKKPDPKQEAETDEKRAGAFDKRASGVKKLVEAAQTELQAQLMSGQIPTPEQQAAAAATEAPAGLGGGVPSMPPPMQGPTGPPAALANNNPMGALQPGAGVPPAAIPGVPQP